MLPVIVVATRPPLVLNCLLPYIKCKAFPFFIIGNSLHNWIIYVRREYNKITIQLLFFINKDKKWNREPAHVGKRGLMYLHWCFNSSFHDTYFGFPWVVPELQEYRSKTYKSLPVQLFKFNTSVPDICHLIWSNDFHIIRIHRPLNKNNLRNVLYFLSAYYFI